MIPVRDAIVQGLKDEDLGFVSVEGHDGDFNLAEIRKHFGHGNAARVVCTGVAEIEPQGDMPVARTQWAVFVAAQSRTANDPDGAASAGDAALALATKLVALVMKRGQHWNDTAFRAPEGVKMRNLYSGKLADRGIGLWVVTWDQLFEITDQLESSLDQLLQIHTDYDVGSGPDHATDTEYS